VLIDKRFGTWWVIPLLILGFAAGIRNAAILLTNALKEDEKAKNKDTERMTDNEEE
jgi:ATP synthase protein I